MLFGREDKLTLSSTRRTAAMRARWLRWVWIPLVAVLVLLWHGYTTGVTRRFKISSPAKKQRIAFVVLTDPHEDHEHNVIPMLAHVEAKYGER